MTLTAYHEPSFSCFTFPFVWTVYHYIIILYYININNIIIINK